MTGPLLFPLGHYLGPHHPGPGRPAEHHVVRIGATWNRLESDRESAVWGLAHGWAGRLGAGPWTAGALVTAARERAGVDASGTVAALLRRGLLVEVDPRAPAAVEFARRCRLSPLALGLGNEPRRPGEFRIGLGDRVAATVAPGLFQFWHWAPVSPSLYAACERYAADSVALGSGENTPQEALAAMLGQLHFLLAARVGYLDIAEERSSM
jgi:hypothetical protein